MVRMDWRGFAVRLAGASLALLAVLGLPAAVAAHGLSPVYRSPLPLAVYLAGAGATVALSFVLILARNLRAAPSPSPVPVRVPRVLRVALRVLGLAAWAWIMLQGIAGGSSAAAVAPLFLWIYGWVGLAAISALFAPIWEWLDPFATLHDMLAWVIRRVGVKPWAPAALPRRARHWPAVAGFAFLVWVELVAAPGSEVLTIVLAAYTVLTLALMAQYGRDRWRGEGETFTVWFRTLNRLAPFAVALRDASGAPSPARIEDTPDTSILVRRPFASGLLDAAWSPPIIVLVALGTASIIFDGLSQTVVFATIFGAPPLLAKTLLLAAWLALVALAALWVARTVSPGAIGAGLLPIAVGYLVAHYLTWLLIDGQALVVAVSDPLQQGWDLFGTAFYEPSAGWLPPGLVWTMQLAAVVGGHMLGAWAGHVTALRDLEVVAPGNGNGNGRAHRDIRHRTIRDTAPLPAASHIRVREIPLAIVMVSLTVVTLWSLGQAIVVDEPLDGVQPAVVAGS
jgi:hypothetical protein